MGINTTHPQAGPPEAGRAPVPALSRSLVRAVMHEAQRLDRLAERAALRRQALIGQLVEVDAELEEYRRRRNLLDVLCAVPPSPVPDHPQAPPLRTLRGAAMRRVAGTLLWRQRRDREIHYRDWFALTLAAGYAISGQDPLASFLTNIRDSPAVARGSPGGHYRLDAGCVPRLERETADIRRELTQLERSLVNAYAGTEDVTDLRHRCGRARARLRKLERQTREVLHIFAA
jgi:hypothetical protein